MAKLAVLICRPKNPTTHCSLSAPSRRSMAGALPFPSEGEPGPTQGRWLDCKVPLSRANCSRVMGRNDPSGPTKSKSNPKLVQRVAWTYQRRRPRILRPQSHKRTIRESRAGLSAWYLRRDSEEAADGRPPVARTTRGVYRPWG